ncbi:MAG: fatty acid desaturase [Luteibaculum sp.]
MRYLPYCIPILLCLLFYGLTIIGWHWVFLALLVSVSQLNKVLGEFAEEELQNELLFFDSNSSFQRVKYLIAIFFIAWNFWLFSWIGTQNTSFFALLNLGLSAAILNCTFALSLAHDLSHKRNYSAKLLSQSLLIICGQPLFKNDHIFGHHKKACTPEDLGSAKYNQSFYSYLKAVIPYRIKESLSLNPSFPNRKRNAIFWENVFFLGLNLLLFVALILMANQAWNMLLFLVLQSAIIYGMFELSNYIQHYGLRRSHTQEKLGVQHAWDYYHKYSNYIAYLMPLHSYHHAHTSQRDEIVIDPETKMPHCYYKMMFLALFPTAWFKEMNPRIQGLYRQVVPKKAALVLILLYASLSLSAQHNFGFKYFGLSIHPSGDEQADLMPHRLDDNGVLVMNFGGIISYQKYFLSDLLSFKVAQGIYSDCGGMLSGHTHIGFRATFLQRGRHSALLGFGPTFIYRRNWNKKPDYEPTGIFKESGDLQYKFVFYGGEVEYNYQVNEKFDLSIHFLPGYPIVMSLGVGFRYWPFRYF